MRSAVITVYAVLSALCAAAAVGLGAVAIHVAKEDRSVR